MDLVSLRDRLVNPGDLNALRASLKESDESLETVRTAASRGEELARQVLGARLWALAWLDDREYMELLYSHYGPGLQHTAEKLAKNEADAAEIAQEAWLRAWRSVRKERDLPSQPGGPRGEDTFVHWLATLGTGWVKHGALLPRGSRPEPRAEWKWLTRILINVSSVRRNPPLFEDHEILAPDLFCKSLRGLAVPDEILRHLLQNELAEAVLTTVQAEKSPDRKRRPLRVALNKLVQTSALFALFRNEPLLQEFLSDEIRIEIQALPLKPGLWKRVFVNRLILFDLFPTALAKPVILTIVEADEQQEFTDENAPSPDVALREKEAERSKEKKRTVAVAELLAHLKYCLSDSTLTDPQREALVLQYIAGLNQHDGAKVAGAKNNSNEYDDTVFNNRTGRAVKVVRSHMKDKHPDLSWSADLDPFWAALRADGFVPELPDGARIGVVDLLSRCLQDLSGPQAEAFAVHFLGDSQTERANQIVSTSTFHEQLRLANAAVMAFFQKNGRDARPLIDPESDCRETFWAWLRNSNWSRQILRSLPTD